MDPAAYNALLAALASGDPDDFEAIPLGGVRPLRNPQAGLAFDLEGPDSHHLAIRPAPRIDGPENSAEAAELYWMALARDVRFTDYASSPLIAQAAADLSAFSDFRGPKQAGQVTPATIFRGNTPGDLAGPYLSQFLLKECPFGSLTISQRQQTVVAGLDYLTAFEHLARHPERSRRPARTGSTPSDATSGTAVTWGSTSTSMPSTRPT